ncbi:hypothetical protein TEA_016050 [Camellia sinensis var. sinensis]|uniref:Uncharacterized protein n=1 Tax=Camellia sinensis var. sinensis TaxID=542762 RepID=A0A4S4E6N5_CAMSN|nr:hypothetical protein TEA_016050 [Camellia sinensis var. sinensis]
MIEKTKKHKKGSISEKDISTLLQRYEATTMLTLLQEVAQIQDVKIDWNALVKKTATGISNVREYQMLWRHLAYRDTLVERLDDGAEPLIAWQISDFELADLANEMISTTHLEGKFIRIGIINIPLEDSEGVLNEAVRWCFPVLMSMARFVFLFPGVDVDMVLALDWSSSVKGSPDYENMNSCVPSRNPDSYLSSDDDSDLDYELEVLPPVGSEASTESAACVKVLIASGLQSDISLSNGLTVEAPLTINIPNGQSSRGPLENSLLQGTNITIPVSVQKQPLPMVMSEVLDANGSASGNLLPRRKRKPWSAVEDLELIAAVQKCGEGNWANILKGDFKHDRTALQLSQRWTIIRKRRSNVHVGGGSQLLEAQLAARRAVSLALNMPMVDSLTAACSNGIAVTNLNTAPSNSTRPAAVEASVVGTQSQHLSRRYSIPTTSKSRVTIKSVDKTHSQPR